jgi:hypothetical protein
MVAVNDGLGLTGPPRREQDVPGMLEVAVYSDQHFRLHLRQPVGGGFGACSAWLSGRRGTSGRGHWTPVTVQSGRRLAIPPDTELSYTSELALPGRVNRPRPAPSYIW